MMPKCTCASPSGWNPLGHSHGCPMRQYLEKYGPPHRECSCGDLGRDEYCDRHGGI